MDLEIKKKKWRRLPNGDQWNQAAWKEARRRVIQSKEPYCAICHGYIDMSAPAFSPDACEIDHIVPISRGGLPYDVENLQLTHTRCNRRKGAKMESDYAGLESENICPLSNRW